MSSMGRMFVSGIVLFAVSVFGIPAWAGGELQFKDVEVLTDSEAPRACFQFSGKLDGSGKTHYGDYVRIQPEIVGEFTARGDRLCVAGMAYGQVYGVTLLPGLPAAAGDPLPGQSQFNVAIQDRPPNLDFPGGTYILPSEGKRELAIDAVNVSAADITIVRINDRNLINEINAGRIAGLMSSWDIDRIRSMSGEEVWTGTIDIAMVKNRTVNTAIPVGEVLGKPKPGIYAVMAVPKESSEYRYQQATQWMVVTDIGISSYDGEDGLRVFLRSLNNATPLGGVDVRLIARNNEVLGSARTDAAGVARFQPGLMRGTLGSAPGAVMAFGADGGFSFLELTRPAFDLTDRGVGGRVPAGPVDGFVYTERGVYRPGETVNVVTLLRDGQAQAITGAPVSLRILRPDGSEQDSVTVAEGQLGGYGLELPLSGSAHTGRWTVEARIDPKGQPVGIGHFQVEDFVPERMDVKLTAESPMLVPGTENAVLADAQFLYGAPGAGLAVTGEIVLQQDMNPYPEFKGYQFGLVQEEWRARREELAEAETDDAGQVRVPVALDEVPDSSRPLKAMVRLSVAETGGRAVSRTISLPVRGTGMAIGIRPRFEGDWVDIKKNADFDIVVLDRDGKSIAADGLIYQLVEENWRYRWYYEDDSWGYKILIDDGAVQAGPVNVAAGTPAVVKFHPDWGNYRLEVHDTRTGAATSVRFRMGWYSSSRAADVPDQLQISLDRESYKTGDVAHVHVRPPFAGRALVTVSGSRVYETLEVDVPAEGSVVDIPVKPEWDAGVYVTATVFRPAGGEEQRGPARAVGVAWLARDYSERTLDVSIVVPERIVPRQRIEADVAIEGLAKGEQAFVTLAAVDVGILQLTDFKTPAPADWYFGKRQLGVALRDGYGYLIQAATGAAAQIRQGGDEAADRQLGGLDASSVKTVSLFSGVVQVGADGHARIPLDIPDFNGRLRLMAVAWSGRKVGSGESAMVVRDAVVSLATLPRFLAPGDRSQVNVSLHNVDGPAGAYQVSIVANGAVSATGGATSLPLEHDAHKDIAFTLTGDRAGVGQLTLVIQGPDNLHLERDWEIAVRPAQPVITRQVVRELQSKQRATVTADLLEEFVPGTGETLVTLSNTPAMDLAGLLKSLDRYPYGCAEQTTSRALPLLYLSDVAASVGISTDATTLRYRVQGAIHRLLTMQRSDGSFGLWDSSSPREEWLSAYVMDFLSQARELKYPVPDFAYNRGLRWLADSVRAADFSRANLPARVYALYVLARVGEVKVSDLRYVHDTLYNSLPTGLARAQLGAALALAGDPKRAESAFARASNTWSRSDWAWNANWGWYDYGTVGRDRAAAVYLAAANNVKLPNWNGIVKDLADWVGQTRYLSTQEQVWTLLAAHALGSQEPVRVSAMGKSLPESRKPVYLRFADAELASGADIANLGDARLWMGITVSGVPRDDLKADRNGFVISRSFYTMDGSRANLGNIRQGDILVAVISGEAIDRRDRQAIVVDLLPAGFELENASLVGGRGTEELGWLPKLTETVHTELRDDRFVAALNLRQYDGDKDFYLAYVVRAVSPGTFRLPAPYVEDMYEPTWFARGSMDSVSILKAK